MSIAGTEPPSSPRPPAALAWSAGDARLFRATGGEGCGRAGFERFDPWDLAWQAAAAAPADLTPVAQPEQALQHVFTAPGARRVPVGVIGPRNASDAEYALALALGRLIAGHGLQLICGGMDGVMEAACKGHLEAGGAPIGLLPETEWRSGNPYVAIPIATGIGPVRNAILARASLVLVAIGGGYGTLTEMAYGLHFDRPVLTLGQTPFVDGARPCATPEEAIRHIARHLLEEAPRAGG